MPSDDAARAAERIYNNEDMLDPPELAAIIREECPTDELRAALVASNSKLSLVRHRYLNTLALSDARELERIDAVLSQSRAALAATEPDDVIDESLADA